MGARVILRDEHGVDVAALLCRTTEARGLRDALVALGFDARLQAANDHSGQPVAVQVLDQDDKKDTDTEEGEASQPGAWLSYYSDRSGLVLHAAEIDALRQAVRDTAKVTFWPYGTDLGDVERGAR